MPAESVQHGRDPAECRPLSERPATSGSLSTSTLSDEARPDPKLAPVSLVSSSLLAAVAGALGGALAALLMLSLDDLQGWIWGVAVARGLANQRPLSWCLAIPTTVGLILSLLVWRRPRQLLPEFAETIASLSGSDPIRQPFGCTWRPILGGVLALLAGGSLGPEALVTHGVRQLSQLVWRGQDQRVSAAALSGSLALFQTPLAGPTVLLNRPLLRKWQLLWRWLPGSLAALAGFLCFRGVQALGGGLQGVPYAAPLLDGRAPGFLLTALIGGLLGSGCGLLLLRWRHWLKQRCAVHPWPWMPVITGLVIGVTLWALPLAAFSGELQIRPLVLGHWALTPGLLILSGAMKLLLVGLCLETGWRGGQIFPMVLGSGAMGLGLHGLLPQLGTAASWGGSLVGGCLAMVIPSPLVALVLGLSLLRGHGAVALLLGVLISRVVVRRMHQWEAASSGSSRP